MDQLSDALTQPFLLKPISNCTVEEIQNIAHTHPYFAAAQLALLKKLQQEHLPEYETQLQKAVLYYYDPVQFDAFVHSDKFITGFDFTPALTETPVEEEATEAAIASTTDEPVEDNEVMEASAAQSTSQNETIATATEQRQTDAPAEMEPAIPLPAPPESTLTFEPYHTVDYFASQGIKLSQADAGTDRMSRQLRSFTEWLKTMKRLPEPELAAPIDASTEHQVQHLAAHSLQNTDIVTEAMAEVWLKQGNTEKAIEVYNKLSLQNPSKKAYFAAKIDQLKKSS